LVARFSNRISCSKCGFTGALQIAGLTEGGDCPKCGARAAMGRRKDDQPEAVRERLRVYEAETRPVFDVLSAVYPILQVDALRPQDVVFQDILGRFN
jgi:adenylate kinase